MRSFRLEESWRILGVAVAIVVFLVVLKTAGLLIGAIVLGLSIGVALGGRITRLATLEFRALAFFGLGVSAAVVSTVPVTSDLQRGAYALSFWLLLVFAAFNARAPGATLIAAGLLAQALVVTANGGAMPYSSEAATIAGATVGDGSSLQVALGQHSQLPFLADVIPFPFNGRAYSLGDLLIAAGLFRFGFSATVGARNRNRPVLHPQAQGEVAR